MPSIIFEKVAMKPLLLNFSKMHGLGNDFVILDATLNPELFDATGKCTLTKTQISLIGNRNLGIGCNQILLVNPCVNGSADFDYLIYNSDGSTAEYCGNGARCIVKYLLEKYPEKTSITLNTNGHLTHGSIDTNKLITINVGIPEFDPLRCGYMLSNKIEDSYKVNQDGQITFGVVSMGNPHAAVKIDLDMQLQDTKRLQKVANLLQQPWIFNNSVNVSFFIIKDRHHINMRTYERGCGFTQACGSGACATASYAIKNNWVDGDNLKLSQPGGDIYISWDKTHELIMTGDATHVFDGAISLC